MSLRGRIIPGNTNFYDIQTGASLDLLNTAFMFSLYSEAFTTVQAFVCEEARNRKCLLLKVKMNIDPYIANEKILLFIDENSESGFKYIKSLLTDNGYKKHTTDALATQFCMDYGYRFISRTSANRLERDLLVGYRDYIEMVRFIHKIFQFIYGRFDQETL